MMTGTKSDIKKFDGKNDFALWQVRMKALLEQQGLTACDTTSRFGLVKEYERDISWQRYCCFLIPVCLSKVLQRDEFEVEPQDGHTFEVEPHGNVDHVVEDSNETAFAVAAVGKIYAHESLTFNNTVACEVISKWKAGLKDDMDARSDVYVLSNGYKKCSDDSDGYYWESTPVGSHEYQMVCTRLDIASADVGLDQSQAAYMTLTGAWKKKIWLKGLMAESGYELSLVAGIAIGALVKGGSRSEVPAQVEGAAYRY
ncbi:hypothetical protein Tco_1113202 [Tanacetum coccineum]|uniref:Zinc finger, CCHC-type n=1 Tax=Tanacetum coccineum TaxID=301880 RepID=A0ABQ5IV89_9ASTR